MIKIKAISKNSKMVLDKERVQDKGLKNVISFYFSSDIDVEKFISKCLKKKKTRWMLNRLQWFIELSDFQMYDSVKIFFLLAMAETNIKLLENRFGKNDSQIDDIKKFFSLFSQQNKDELCRCFFRKDETLNRRIFTFDKVVDILLNVRHRIAHGKNHYDFRFHNGSDDLINTIFGEVGSRGSKKKIMYELEITYDNFRQMMIENAIENIKKVL